MLKERQVGELPAVLAVNLETTRPSNQEQGPYPSVFTCVARAVGPYGVRLHRDSDALETDPSKRSGAHHIDDGYDSSNEEKHR